MFGEHFLFTALMAVILLTSFTIVSTVPLWAANLGKKDEEDEEEVETT